MKLKNAPLLIFSLIFAPGAQAADPSHAHQSFSASMSLNNGKKWVPDQTLKANMVKIRTQFEKVDKLNQKNKAKSADFKALADQIDQSVMTIIKKCKLAPKADITLHAILAEMVIAKDKLREPSSAAQGLHGVRQALEYYPRYFEAPGK